jgi:GNAT superfamily N-acetyltransferase
MPLACFVAVERSAKSVAPTPVPVDVSDTLIGFACYEATCRDFFGPQLVHPTARGRGVGKALLLAAMHAMRAEGYSYATRGLGVVGRVLPQGGRRHLDRGLGARHLSAPARAAGPAWIGQLNR